MGKIKNKNPNIKDKLPAKLKKKFKKFPKKVDKEHVHKNNQVILPKKQESVKIVSKLSKLLENADEMSPKRPKWNEIPLRERMWKKLKSARFRYVLA